MAAGRIAAVKVVGAVLEVEDLGLELGGAGIGFDADLRLDGFGGCLVFEAFGGVGFVGERFDGVAELLAGVFYFVPDFARS